MKSLDPRINRLDVPEERNTDFRKDPMDQLETYEVFIQPKVDKPFQHEGIVHATDQDMAFVFAKEQYSRRGTCSGIMIIKTADVFTTAFSDAGVSIYQKIKPASDPEDQKVNYEVFHLMKRGKQHTHVGIVRATSTEDAVFQAKMILDQGKPVFNVWVAKSDNIYISEVAYRDIWDTLPEKTFREAIDYRGAEKIKKFKDEQGSQK
ncbi:MAG: phenylacetic acid degradation b [Bacteroidetes bacterium]|nr:phenylacetic acid degradation b [Bacteroidota bacterium]MCH8234083.1 phenylacetic acid degradation b [Bacteroidota bacterium]